jgi:hypothetical protein
VLKHQTKGLLTAGNKQNPHQHTFLFASAAQKMIFLHFKKTSRKPVPSSPPSLRLKESQAPPASLASLERLYPWQDFWRSHALRALVWQWPNYLRSKNVHNSEGSCPIKTIKLIFIMFGFFKCGLAAHFFPPIHIQLQLEAWNLASSRSWSTQLKMKMDIKHNFKNINKTPVFSPGVKIDRQATSVSF